jgi:invasion protein IalB
VGVVQGYNLQRNNQQQRKQVLQNKRKEKRNNWTKQCNKERDKEKNSLRYKILQQTVQFGSVIHQIYIKANVRKNKI